MYLRNLVITFRSFESCRIENLGPINVFIGPNNSGKTSIFEAMLRIGRAKDPGKEDALLFHECEAEGWNEIFADIMSFAPDPGIMFRTSLGHRKALATELMLHPKMATQLSTALRRMGDPAFQTSLSSLEKDNTISPHTLSQIIDSYYSQRSAAHFKAKKEEFTSFTKKEIRQRQELERDFHQALQSLYYLGHSRGGTTASKSGKHERLDPLARNLPGRLDYLIRNRPGSFRHALDRFVASVVPEVGEIAFELQDELTEIVYDTSAGRIPLNQLGGGVEQVLAIAAVLLGEPDDAPLLLEEPESHLHEAAQRKLVAQIEAHRGTRQLFIATHSPVFMNAFSGASIYRVSKALNTSSVDLCVSSGTQRQALDTLGVLPSTILQANFIVWIEGPTERILIKHWLHLLSPELREHEHYEFLMTSGTLLTHLSADDAREDLILMRKACRHGFAVSDCDGNSDAPPAKLAARRVAQEFGAEHSWITDGYEIEWYFTPTIASGIWEKISLAKLIEVGFFDVASRKRPFYEMLAERFPDAEVKTAEKRKVANARKATEFGREVWFGSEQNSDLEARIQQLSSAIAEANGLNRRATDRVCGTCGRPEE